MALLPVIVGMGGMNAAGRTSCFHGYKRMLCDVLDKKTMESTWYDLAHRMGVDVSQGLSEAIINRLKQGTLIRRIETFDPNHIPIQVKGQLTQATRFTLRHIKLPTVIPPHWQVKALDEHLVEVTIAPDTEILVPATTTCPVSCGGSLPSGFNPATLYNSHHHPRALSLAIYGASDALHTLGISWEEVLHHIHPDEVSVYAGSALSQIDEHSLAGLIGNPLRGQRPNSKMMAMSLTEMSADFINSYVINSIGQTGTQVGACASFLYNLKQGVMDIQTGRAKVAMIGSAEAPLVPAVIEGFYVMGALATDEALCALDKTDRIDYRRACRPFSTNLGFTLGEGAQFVILMHEELALTLGVPIYGSVADVFIHADGNKKSIAKPGVGNYLTFAKATALAQAILGKPGLQQTYVSAHGTGTPQNRTTESHLINLTASTFGLKAWPVTAIKAYLGHTIGAASGDQLMNALGVWQYGYIPGIKTIDHIAEDVHCSHLNILTEHTDAGEKGQAYKATLINSKGFGGNNATGLILSPHETTAMLKHKYGEKAVTAYLKKSEKIQTKIAEYDQAACAGKESVFYHFGTEVMEAADVTMTPKQVKFSRFEKEVCLSSKNPYQDYT